MKRLKIAVLVFLRSIGVFALARMLTRADLRILCYHGGQIGDEGKFNPLLFGSPVLLDQRLKWLLSKGFTPSSIDLLNADGAKSSVGKSRLPVIVTADDGWYSTIASIIETCRNRGFPICVYVSTKQLVSGLPVASVVLGYLLWKRRTDTLDGAVNHLTEAIFGTRRFDFRLQKDKSGFIAEVSGYIEKTSLSRQKVIEIFEVLGGLLGVEKDELNLQSRRFDYMSTEELIGISASGCSVQLHGHVHNYPIDNPSALSSDIRACQGVLMGLGFSGPWHYCYPSGSFDKFAKDVLAREGVVSATTCHPGLVDLSAMRSKKYLPRFLDGENVSQIEFEAEMSGVMSLFRWAARMLGQRSRVPLLGE